MLLLRGTDGLERLRARLVARYVVPDSIVEPLAELMRIQQIEWLRSAMIVTAMGLALANSAAESIKAAPSDQPLFQNLSQAQWKKMFPELGDASPEIAILHVDPKTEATQLLIRTPKALHVRQHWHSANETHTMISGNATFACEGNRVELGPGGFNYMPARMVHEAWTTAGSVVFITVGGPWDVNWVQGPPTSADVIQ